MSSTDAKVTKIGVNTITEYPDGTTVIEQNGHKVTTHPDGMIEADMNGGHKSVINKSGVFLTLNYPVIKYVHPQNMINVVSVNTVNHEKSLTKEITFTNGGTVSCTYGILGDVLSISTNGVNFFSLNVDGTEIAFDISEQNSNLTVH